MRADADRREPREAALDDPAPGHDFEDVRLAAFMAHCQSGSLRPVFTLPASVAPWVWAARAVSLLI
jgi:hypothetical protein